MKALENILIPMVLAYRKIILKTHRGSDPYSRSTPQGLDYSSSLWGVVLVSIVLADRYRLF